MRRRIGYHRVIAKQARGSMEEPDESASFINVCEKIVSNALSWRYSTMAGAESTTAFLYDFEQRGDFYVGRFVRLRRDDLVTFEENGGNFAQLELEGSSLSEIMHFVYSPSLSCIAVDAGRSVPGVIQLFRYLNIIQGKEGYIADGVRLEAHVIGHPDIVSELRKYDSVHGLTVVHDDGNTIDTSSVRDVGGAIPRLGRVGRVTQVFTGVKRGRAREDVMTTTDLISMLNAEEFNVGAFGNVSAEVATEYGEITLRLFGDKIKEYVELPHNYYSTPSNVYDRLIHSINGNREILRDQRD